MNSIARGETGGRRRWTTVPGTAAGLVPWEQGVLQRVVGANERQGGARTLWRRDSRVGGREGSALMGQELKKLGWEESDFSRRRKGDKEKIKIALRVRRDDIGMDCATAGDGNPDASEPPPLLAEQGEIAWNKFTILGADPFFDDPFLVRT